MCVMAWYHTLLHMCVCVCVMYRGGAGYRDPSLWNPFPGGGGTFIVMSAHGGEETAFLIKFLVWKQEGYYSYLVLSTTQYTPKWKGKCLKWKYLKLYGEARIGVLSNVSLSAILRNFDILHFQHNVRMFYHNLTSYTLSFQHFLLAINQFWFVQYILCMYVI